VHGQLYRLGEIRDVLENYACFKYFNSFLLGKFFEIYAKLFLSVMHLIRNYFYGNSTYFMDKKLITVKNLHITLFNYHSNHRKVRKIQEKQQNSKTPAY